jgi:hypothetical protein
MKTLSKRLENLNLDLFYCVTLWKGHKIELQGKANSETLAYCKELGANNFELSDNGFLECEIAGFKIVLT